VEVVLPNFIDAERHEDILILRLNRPENLNALNMTMRDELWQYLTLIRDDISIKSVVLYGEGDRAFSAGADITEFGTAPSVIDARAARANRDLWQLMQSLDTPLIAALQGFSFGAGLEMALYCDLRVAEHNALFALPEVKLGYIPSAGGTQTLPRHINATDSSMIITSGNPIDAEKAYQIGLVQYLTEYSKYLQFAIDLALEIAHMNPTIVRAVKRAVRSSGEMEISEGLAYEIRVRLSTVSSQ
jgi:enoyl-CoA hydratase/carnithine racemase